MNWTQLLRSEIEATYQSTTKLLDKVDPDKLGWKPETGSNWMTMGQLLKHISIGCGAGCEAFVTGNWGLPEGKKFEDLPPEEILPPAEKLPSIESVSEAKQLLAEDKELAIRMIEKTGEDCLNKETFAPWAANTSLPLGQHFLRMLQHLDRHKSQLFYYLKLQGKSLNTMDLWGS